MPLIKLPPELLLHIYRDCTVSSLLALTGTCHRLHDLLQHHSRKLSILFTAADNEYGPQSTAVQLLTYNDSQPAHIHHEPPQSLLLLKNLIKIGKIAESFVHLYPGQKWKDDYVDRRSLAMTEAFRVRRAVYRLWLFARAFHTPFHARLTRNRRDHILPRIQLLRGYSTAELIEMLDMFNILRQLVRKVCPSDSDVRRKQNKRYPDLSILQHFGSTGPEHTHPTSLDNDKYLHWRSQSFPAHLGMPTSDLCISHQGFRPTGWGDEVHHYYVLEDMLKLDPGQILWLVNHRHELGKSGVESWIGLEMQEGHLQASGGGSWRGSSVEVGACRAYRGFRGVDEDGRGCGWFDNNGQTFEHTWASVIEERGLEVEEIREIIGEGNMGVTRKSVR